MSLNVVSPSPWHPPHSLSPPFSRTALISNKIQHSTLLFMLLRPKPTSSSFSSRSVITSIASSSGSSDLVDDVSQSQSQSRPLLTPDILARVAAVRDADEALQVLDEMSQRKPGLISSSNCCSIIAAALNRNNTDLALSLLYAMRRDSFQQDTSETSGDIVDAWKWPRPDVNTYSLLVRGLASLLRVSDALKVIANVCRVEVSHGEEVPFGVIVKCPSCMIAISVAQPQHGSQIVSCFKCRYRYELVSGSIASIESEELSMDVSAWKRGLSFLQLMNWSTPAAVHSVVVQTPSGMARTHRFATKTVDLPAQEGERVTIALASPSNVYREVGPLKFNPKSPSLNPGEPLCLTNHKDGRESPLLRAPTKDGSAAFFSPSLLFPLLAVAATGDAASGIIDPSLPQFISVAVLASFAVGSTVKFLVVPQLSRLPGRTVEAVAIKQQLLAQYDLLQSRIRDLREVAEKEIWILARMCQLENKIVAVGEPSYRSRRSRIKRVRESLENSIQGRVELIDSFAKISSMIEIEIEMDTDVVAAEDASNVERIAEQIQQIMELENLEEKWRIQAEAKDEVERLLSSQTSLPGL